MIQRRMAELFVRKLRVGANDRVADEIFTINAVYKDLKIAFQNLKVDVFIVALKMSMVISKDTNNIGGFCQLDIGEILLNSFFQFVLHDLFTGYPKLIDSKILNQYFHGISVA